MGNQQLKPPVRRYQVPAEMVSLLTAKCNALDGAEPMAGAVHRWSLEISLFTGAQYARISNTAQFAAYFWPYCADPNKYDTLVKFMIHVFIVDDHLECAYGHMARRVADVQVICGQLFAACDKVLSLTGTGQHVPAHHWKPYVLGAYAIYDTVCAAYNDIQKRRFIQLVRDFHAGSVTECFDIDRKRQYSELDQFFQVRLKSGGVKPCLQLIEYADGLYVPEPEWQNPIFQRLLEMLCRLVVICNDMYSFEKELMDADGCADRVHNCVAVLAQMDNISLTESMSRWVADYNVLEKRTIELANEVMDADWTSPDTRLFVGHALTLIGGHWKVSTFLVRYHTMLKPELFQ